MDYLLNAGELWLPWHLGAKRKPSMANGGLEEALLEIAFDDRLQPLIGRCRLSQPRADGFAQREVSLSHGMLEELLLVAEIMQNDAL